MRVIAQIVGNLGGQLEVKDANRRERRESLHDRPLKGDLGGARAMP
jgi:hypothetical protein